MKPKISFRHFLSVAGSSLFAVSAASAQSTYTWAGSNVTNTPGTLDWFTGGPNTQANWTGGTPASGNLNTIQFFTSTATAVPNTTTVTQGSNLNNGGNAFQLGTLTFSGQAPAPANIDLTMNVAGDALNFSAATGTINLDSLDVGGNGRNITWNVSNAIQLGTASSASTLTLAGSGSSAFNLTGSFTELQSGGGSKLAKSGSSVTILSGAVTVSGGLEVNGGVLRLTNSSNAITGGITLNGGTLGDNGGTISTATLNNNNITVNGAANLGLTGGATTNGGITLNAGADLALATNNNSATINGAVTGVGSISINRLGGGSHTQNLNSTANAFTGTISFIGTSVVTLNTNSLADSASPGTGNIRFVGSAGSSAHTFALGSGAIAPVTLDNRRIEIVSGSAATYTVNNNSSQAFTINTDLLVGATGARTLTLGGTGTGLSTFGGKIENGTGTVSISKAGSGTWHLSGDNTYTGTTTVSAGDLITTKAAALSGYDSAAKVIFNGGALGVRVGGSGWSTAQVDTLLTNATKTSGALGIDTTNGDLTQWTAFTTTNLGSALGIKKLGANTLTLDQSNTFAGALTVAQGTVAINTINNASTAGVLGNSANAVVLGSSGNTGTLLYTGATASSTKTFTAATSGTGVFDVQEAASNLTLSGIIGGSGDITKQGSGILTLGAANTYSGTTNVNAGELRWGITNAIAAGALNINEGGTANIQTFTDTVGTVTIAKGGSITGSTGTLTTGSGGLVSNNGGSISGFTTGGIAANLVTYNDTIVGSTTLNIQRLRIGNLTLNVARGDDASGIDVNIDILQNSANAGRTIVKNGSGVAQLSGSIQSESFGLGDGATTINDGTLIFNKSAEVSATGSGLITIGDDSGSANSAVLQFRTSNNQIGNNAITIKSDGRFDLNGRSETTSGAVINNGSITTGAGTLTLSNTGATALTMGGTGSINGNITMSGANNAVGITATGDTTIAGVLALGTTNNRAIAVTGASDKLAISAQLTGGSGRTLTKSGAGILTLSSDNTGFAAGISVTEGTLLVTNTTGSGTGSGAVTVGTSGTLGGSGTITGATTINGAFMPGNSPGILNFTTSLALAATSTTTLEIDGAIRGSEHDGVNVGTTLTLGGGLVFDLGTVFLTDTTFNLFDAVGTTGDFSTVSLTGSMGSGSFTFDSVDVWSYSSGGNDWTFTQSTGDLALTVIPEPRAALLGAIGLIALLRRRR